MSDAEDADSTTEGSGSFDKEAERQRLREKYEEDKAGRRETERMSELLLQGATMTNAHCDECGNPIFRYDGEEFCSVCDQPGAETTETGEPTPEAGTAGDAPTSSPDQQPDTDDTAGPPASDDVLPGQAERTSRPPSTGPQQSQSGTIASAREDLVATLSSLAHEAASAENLTHRRKTLEAAREAAEAIAAVDRIE